MMIPLPIRTAVLALAWVGPRALAAPQDAASPFVAAGPFHRVIVRAGSQTLPELARDGAVLWAEDYGSYSLACVNADRAGGLARLQAAGAQLADEMTLVDFNGYRIDGSDPVANPAARAGIPEGLRLAPEANRLRIVQFIGPIRDAWLESLHATGASIVTYAASNAYVVKVDAASAARLASLAREPGVLAITTYEPAYKLRPELRPPSLVASATYDVIVQVIADAEGLAFADALAERSLARLGVAERVLAYLNVKLRIRGETVIELARDARVFAIEPILEARLVDERQGQILAHQLDLSGAQPAGPGYFAWLASKGFPGPNPFDFAVDVEDDGVDRGSTTDVNDEFKVDGLPGGASRLVYNLNYTGDALADGQAGHGNINASIVGGSNVTNSAAFEDSLGYQYGLGIAPWVKLGNSKVFNNFGGAEFSQPTSVRMAAAYNAGARISTNSWAYTGGNDYNADSQSHDAAVRDAVSGTAGNQEMTIVFAAGNSGPGAGSVHPPSTGKNVIAAGASENWRMTGTDGCGYGNGDANDARDVAVFSGRGPTSDGRKRPDILAPGTHIQGAASRAAGYHGLDICNAYWPAGQTLYCWSSGTSHSTPAIAGACALLRQDFLNHGRTPPSPAMTKASLVAGAIHMTGVGANDTLWSNNQGMGRVDLEATFDAADRTRFDQTEVFAGTGEIWATGGTIASPALPFRVVLAWTDAPGPTSGNAYVNNLDLEVNVGGSLYLGNVFSGASSVTGGTSDARNNLESVFLPAGTSGVFTVTVRATNVAGDGVPGNGDPTDQDFALLVYNGESDCNGNGVPDEQDVAGGTSADCNQNGVPDECDIASGTGLDLNGNAVPDVCEPAGTPGCFGDGSIALCPCSNLGDPGRGCANSIGQSALLTALGTTAPDTIVLSAVGEMPTALTIFLQGTLTGAALNYGDGLRCVRGDLKRLYSKSASGGEVFVPQAGDPSITARSAILGDTIPGGSTRYYMTYYRDPDPTYCPSPTGGTFNASNSLTIVW